MTTRKANVILLSDHIAKREQNERTMRIQQDARRRRYSDLNIQQLHASARDIHEKRPADWKDHGLLPIPAIGNVYRRDFPTPKPLHFWDDEYDLLGYVEDVVEDYRVCPEQYLNNPDWYVENYLRDGDELWLQIGADSALLLYSLGPYTHLSHPSNYRTMENKTYHVRVSMFATHSYRQYFSASRISEAYGMEDHFQSVGDWLRDCALQQARFYT